MGYDFGIMMLRPSVVSSRPLDSSQIDESSVEMDLDTNRLDQWLGQFPGVTRNGEFCWLWEVPEGGSVGLSSGSWGVNLDTHADWLAVLEVYLHVRDGYPNAVLWDPQVVLWHDERSFRDFLVAPARTWPELKPEEYSPERLNAMLDEMAQGDRSAGFTLWRLGAKAALMVPRLIELLNHPQAQVQADAITALGHIGAAASSAVPRLVTLAGERWEPPFQTLIHMALGRIGVPDPCAVAILMDTLRDGACWERCTALMSLFQMKQDALALPLLFENMAQANMAHPGCWASGFAGIFDQVNDFKGAIQGLLLLFVQKDATRRLVAALAMDALARRHEGCEVLAVQALRDDWERIRRIAATTLARLSRSQSATAHLERCRADPDREVRARAAWALAFRHPGHWLSRITESANTSS